MMSSVRLYLLPEYTTEGRQPHHGEVSTSTPVYPVTVLILTSHGGCICSLKQVILEIKTRKEILF